MDVTIPLIVGALLAMFTGIQTWINKGRFDAQDRRLDELIKRMDSHERRFDQLMAEVAALRSDLLQVALAAAPRPRPQTG